MKRRLFLAFFITLTITTLGQNQPSQPTTGYGSSEIFYNQVTTFNSDDGVTGFMLYIPDSPHADSLPLIVFTHGFGEWNPMRYGSWIDHLVKRGNIVVFPRYQQNEYTTFSINFTSNTAAGILRAIDTIHAHSNWTQPKLNQVFYMGHSYGGLISANLATKYLNYGIPKPKAVLMACPGYGQYPGGQLSNYGTMDSSIFLLEIIEHEDHVVDSTFALQVFNQTTWIPYVHKNLVIHYADTTGAPGITSTHGEPSCVDSTYDNGDVGVVMSQANFAYTDANDFYCYWKLFDALEDCALAGNGCTTAFGDTPEQKNMGQWSNGTPLIPLEIRPKNNTTLVETIGTLDKTTVYPNPGNGVFTIEMEMNKIVSQYSVEVYNTIGQKINAKQQTHNSKLRIDISTEPKGIYSYRIVTLSGEIAHTGKLLVY
jgi:pimeloyl-ACP methyl ester carboxylesterase